MPSWRASIVISSSSKALTSGGALGGAGQGAARELNERAAAIAGRRATAIAEVVPPTTPAFKNRRRLLVKCFAPSSERFFTIFSSGQHTILSQALVRRATRSALFHPVVCWAILWLLERE